VAHNAELKNKYRRFLKGYHDFRETCKVKHDDVEHAMRRGPGEPDDYLYRDEVDIDTHQVVQARYTEAREMRRTIELLQDGGVGYLPEHKRSGWIRLMFENWNSLGVFTNTWKVDRLKYLIKHLEIDIVAGCEVQCDWSFVGHSSRFPDILANGQALQGLASHNKVERIQREQMGGTAVAAVGRLVDLTSDSGSDPTGLGRWTWIKLGNGTPTTRLLCGYLPCKPGRSSRGRTVWEQHKRFFESRGDFRYPSTIFVEDITNEIVKWRLAGEEVVLAIDANQDVYGGKLALALRDSCQMACLLEPILGERVPNSHFRGTTAISTVFGTPGLVSNNAMCFPHWYGVGDHRVFVLELSAASLFGGEYPTIATPMARQLNCKITRIRDQYCFHLSKLAQRHQMEKKLQKLTAASLVLSTRQLQPYHNRWDNEWGDFMTSAETKCCKFRSCALEFSPTVGQWLKRRTILKWLLKWHDGRVPDTRNLARAARRVGIDAPLLLSRSDVESRLQACLAELFELRSQAPELRKKHLRWRLSEARVREDDCAAREITRIIQAEARRKRQRAINRVVRPPKGRAVLSVKAFVNGEDVTYDTQPEVERACREHLASRFSSGARAPISYGQLATDIGPLGDTEAARRILDATYEFPPGCDTATVDLLRSVAQIRLEINEVPQHTSAVTTEDFHSFWDTAKESTSSSKSGRHFGHYKAACSDPTLVSLHVNNINLAVNGGVPLSRWKKGVTVLLEKVAGNNNIAKLRAICLLEADFNWWLKVIFAKRMMSRMRSQDILPVEQGATSGKTTIDSSMLKQLYFDQANVLHLSCAVSSNDAAHCYDSVNHAAGSLALQAMHVPIHMVLCYLLCIQTMQFFLKTGFGMARNSYGGTAVNPFMILAQGSGASPAAWLAISTVILNAYKHKGYGASIWSAWSGMGLCLAALLYVDDTDLLHISRDATLSDNAFVQKVQEATYYWARLLQATGGSLKPAKCYWYFISYKFIGGQAKLRSAIELKEHRLLIPQPNANDVTISLRDSFVASEVLGVWSSPSGRDGSHLHHMMAKAKAWSSRVVSSPLTRAEVWQSFRTQAWPSVTYGLVPMMVSRATLDNAFARWYYSFLPALGINRNIAHQWRTLPTSFQGLGLPNISLEKLAASLQYIQRHWGCKNPYGTALRSIFELVQIETGLEGNFLLRDYKRYGELASHTWFKVLWEYLDYYGIQLHLDNITVPPVRERDKVFMEEVMRILPPSQWTSLNRARRFFKVYFLSQLVLCDGITVDPVKLRHTKQPASLMIFPHEQPTHSDLLLWRRTVALITSKTFRLSPRLGKFVRRPYDTVYWSTTPTRAVLVKHSPDMSPLLYTPVNRRYNTRGRQTYSAVADLPPAIDCPQLASVLNNGDSPEVRVHSQSILQESPLPTPTTLQETLLAWGQGSLWKQLYANGDIQWISDAYTRGSLVLCHDGSYMPHQDEARCSAAVVILCTWSANQAHVVFCELTDPDTASNYRGEIIGGVIATLLLRALSVCAPPPPPAKILPIYCDNLGVVCHGNAYLRSLPEKQVQQDVLCLLRQNIMSLPHPVNYKHVYGHLDEGASFASLELPQQLNVMADMLAKTELQRCISSLDGRPPTYPLEAVRILVGGKKVTASIKGAIYQHWGKNTAVALFEKKHIVSRFIFPTIYWEGIGRSMSMYPQMFWTWLTKHVSGFCGVNRHLSKIDSSIENVCPCCGHEDESVAHITRCPDPGRQKALNLSVDNIVAWMTETHSDQDMVHCLSSYLRSRGEGSMVEISRPFAHLHSWALEHDTLGWDNFLEGRIGRTLIDIQADCLSDSVSRMHIATWAAKFIGQLLELTHRQWIYRNTKLHLRLVEGMTVPEHDEIMREVLNLLLTDPEEVLPRHQALLDLDMDKLGRGSTADRQYWVATMHSALSAARCVLEAGALEVPDGTDPHSDPENEVPIVDPT
jgi:hypothetical protein